MENKITDIITNIIYRLIGNYDEKKSVKELDDDKKDTISNINTLESLIDGTHTYWKFSQTVPGHSEEKNIFIEYKENEITEALYSDKGLSFTDNEYITKCFMYGDQLTKLCFSKNNPQFNKIKNNSYKYIGGGLNEYETTQLVTEKNYSLQNKATIRLLVELIPDNWNFYCTGWFHNNIFEKRLTEFGFEDSAELLRLINEELNRNLNLKKEDALRIIDNYKDF